MFAKTITAIGAMVALATAAPLPLNAAELAATDFSINVAIVAGSSQMGMWVPTNGVFVSTASLTCLNIGASSYGACDSLVVNQIGALNGYSCTFVGSDGWSASQTGTSSSGFLSVGPPQTIVSVACISN